MLAQFQDRFMNNRFQPGENYFNIVEKADSFYVTNPDPGEGRGQNMYERWKIFWRTRVSSPDSSINGTFTPALRALQTQMVTPVCNSGSPYTANWFNLGPCTSTTQLVPQAAGIVCAVAFDEKDYTSTYYAGTTNSGLWRTTDGGLTWKCLTDDTHLPGLGVSCVAVDHSNSASSPPQNILIGTGVTRPTGSYGLGILRSTDGGMTWAQTDLAYDPAITQNIGIPHKILFDPNNRNIVYALVDDKVYKSMDGGATWPSSSSSSPSPIFTLPPNAFANTTNACVDPNNCTNQPRTLLDIEIHPTNSQILYISTDNLPGSAIGCAASCGTPVGSNGGAELWVSTDAGSSWNELTPATLSNPNNSALYVASLNHNIINSDRIAIAVSGSEPNSIFLTYSTLVYNSSNHNYDEYGYYTKSPDGGISWSTPVKVSYCSGLGLLCSGPGINFWDAYIEVSPTDPTKIYLGGQTVGKTTDGGTTWSSISDYSSTALSAGGHGDIRAMAIFDDGTNNGTLLMGNDGGVGFNASKSSPPFWDNVSKTLPITQFFGFASTDTDTPSNLIVAGAMDNGWYTYDESSGNWTFFTHSDSYNCAVDFSTPPKFFSETINTEMWESDNGNSANWAGVAPLYDGSNTPSPVLVNKSDNNIYWGRHNLWKSSYHASTFSYVWSPITNFGSTIIASNQNITAFAIAPSNPKIIYVAYHSDLFFHTKDGGTNWVETNASTGSGAWAPVTDIAVNPNNEAEVWVTLGGFGNSTFPQRVVHSVDYGTNWVDYSANLPSFPVNTIVCEKGSNGALYVGTDVGVYYRNKSMSQWECFTDGLPVVIVTDLDINYSENVILASTFGRGLWKGRLACPLNTDDTESSLYSADAFIEAEHNIYSTATDASNNITYRAGNQIDLQPGFSAGGTSAYFHAFIHGCDHKGNSFQRYSHPNNNAHSGGGSMQNNELGNVNAVQKEKKAGQVEMVVQPNPNNGTFILQINGKYNPENAVEITDLMGRTVFNKNFVKQTENLNIELQNGTYLIKYYDGIEAHSQPFIINR